MVKTIVRVKGGPEAEILTLPRCLAAAACSGASALTLEILWQRQMFLAFGASAPATTAVLTAIFLGIALGSRASAGLLRRIRRGAYWFAMAEIGVGLFGTLVPFVIPYAEQLYVWSAHRLGENHVLVPVMRFVICVALLLPSTLCMGATTPLLAAGIPGEHRARLAWVYGVNMLGAVLGSLLTGLVLVSAFGNSMSYLAAAVLSASAALLTISMRPAKPFSADVQSEAGREEAMAATMTTSFQTELRGLSVLYFLAGYVALGLEVVWLRFLGIINTNSSVTFAFSLSAYLLGMCVGSLIVFPLLQRRLTGAMILGVANLGTAFGALLTIGLIFRAPKINYERITTSVIDGSLTLSTIYSTEAALTFGLMMLPAVFIGLVYPAVCMCVRGSQKAKDEWVGQAGFVGTLGSVAGILTVSLWVIPAIGLHWTFSLLVIGAGLLGSYVLLQSSSKRLWHSIVLCFVILPSLWFSWQQRPVLREMAATKQGEHWYEQSNANEDVLLSEIRSFRAGPSGTVIIKRKPDSKDHLVYVDDQLVASTNMEARVDSLMLAHLPLLLHSHPESELTVGFGSGGTSFAITTHGIDAWCAEIEPEVPNAARFLNDQNFGVLENPRFHLILNDARDHLAITTRRYDVIATDVTNLQYRQNSSLYTVEYFQRMKARLNEQGIACAWIPMAAISTDELRILMRSFQDVFPHASLWFMNHTHTNFGILIGTPDELSIDYERMASGMKSTAVRENLELIGIRDPFQIIHSLLLDESGYRDFCGDCALHTDDYPVLEFSSPLSFYQYDATFLANLRTAMKHRPRDLQPFVRNVPSERESEWEAHRVASTQFCEVIAYFYEYLIAQSQRDRNIARRSLLKAIECAKTGMDALPDDPSREEFYVGFFEQAQRWLNAQ
ncbi:MAG: hypothetical protein JNM43_08260 [Planctomycetaceae bacterium]|nr:hypothetical protein [Planctomycetaceae bacterium]